MAGIVIVNLGTGNLRSVCKALEYVGAASVQISDQPAVIAAADHLVLPGQGAIGTWMRQLNQQAALADAVRQRLAAGPVLGICLGLQALFDHSEENGGTDCLGLLKGQVRHFGAAHSASLPRLKVPHMGWNQVRQRRQHPLWQGIPDNENFYFVHSYFAESTAPADLAGSCDYGTSFTAAAARDNLFATQFHPEKSQQAGLRLLKNFIHWNGVQ